MGEQELPERPSAAPVSRVTDDQLAHLMADLEADANLQKVWDALAEADRFTLYACAFEKLRERPSAAPVSEEIQQELADLNTLQAQNQIQAMAARAELVRVSEEIAPIAAEIRAAGESEIGSGELGTERRTRKQLLKWANRLDTLLSVRERGK